MVWHRNDHWPSKLALSNINPEVIFPRVTRAKPSWKLKIGNLCQLWRTFFTWHDSIHYLFWSWFVTAQQTLRYELQLFSMNQFRFQRYSICLITFMPKNADRLFELENDYPYIPNWLLWILNHQWWGRKMSLSSVQANCMRTCVVAEVCVQLWDGDCLSCTTSH